MSLKQSTLILNLKRNAMIFKGRERLSERRKKSTKHIRKKYNGNIEQNRPFKNEILGYL